MGWEIVRIWSTDWWVDADGALDKVHERLTALQDAARTRWAEEAARAAAEAEAAVAMESADDVAGAAPIEAVQVPEPAPAARRVADDLF